MYASVVNVTIQSDKIDQAIHFWRDSVVPALMQRGGFKSGLLLTDPATGKGIVISLWATEGDARAFATSAAYQEQLSKSAGLLAVPPDRDSSSREVARGEGRHSTSYERPRDGPSGTCARRSPET